MNSDTFAFCCPGWDKEDFTIFEDTEIHGAWIFTPSGGDGPEPTDSLSMNPEKSSTLAVLGAYDVVQDETEDPSLGGEPYLSCLPKTGDRGAGRYLGGMMIALIFLAISAALYRRSGKDENC